MSRHRFTDARLALVALLALALVLVACPGGHDAGHDAASHDDHGDTAPSNAVLYSVPDDATVSFSIWFKVGSQNDPKGKEGLAALTGAMIAEGATTENAYEVILEKLYPLASSYDVRVDKEMTTLSGRTHRDNLETFFKLFTDAYLKPAFKPEDFARLKSDQRNYIANTLRFAQDEELGKAALFSFIFKGTGYSHPAAGTLAGLDAITIEDVKSFYQTYYTQENAVVALGGGYGDDLAQRFEGTLSSLPSGTPPPTPAPTPPPIEGRHVLLVDKPDADASISFGFPIDVHRGSREFYALWLATSWLGEHRNSSSHLYQVIREIRGMNYGDYAYIEAFPEGGFRQMPPTNVARHQQIFEVWIRTLPDEQALFALRAALREVRNLIDNGLSEEQFKLTQSFLSKYHLHFASTTQERLGYAIDDRFYGVEGEGHLSRFGEVIPQLTREEVNAAIKKHWQLENLKIAIVTGDAAGLEEALVSNTATPIEYPTEKSEEVLAEDKMIAEVPFDIAEDGVEVISVTEIFGS